MYSASFADDSHLRLLGGHGSGGGGGGRSLRSTQGFGPKTYDPYNINTSIGPVGASSSKKPKTWDGKGFTNFFRKEINEISYLHSINHKEYGFAAIWNHKKQEMRASELLKGKGDSKWFSLREASDLISLEDGDVIVGFFHSHNSHRHNEINQFSWGRWGSKDYGNFVDLLLYPNEYKHGSDLNVVFLGVVTLKEIQILQVKNVDNFLKIWYNSNYDRDFRIFKNAPNQFFMDKNFYHERRK